MPGKLDIRVQEKSETRSVVLTLHKDQYYKRGHSLNGRLDMLGLLEGGGGQTLQRVGISIDF